MTSWTPRRALLAGAVALLCACGGGETGSSTVVTSRFKASSLLAGKCAAPRTGDQPGSMADEKAWVRSWIDELYLWYGEVPDVDATAYATADAYFEALKTPALTDSGRPKDRFHFTYPTSEWVALMESGADVGYGVQWAVLSPTVPRQVVVAYDEPGSAADANGIARGAEVLSVDGADLVNGSDVATLNAGLWPSSAGEAHTFVLQAVAGSTTTVTLTAGTVVSTPVQAVKTLTAADGQPVGYFLFNDHVATAEAALVSAITTLKASGVSDLVVDLRYNGGGYLDIASELSFMIAGPTATAGKTFELTVFNDKYARIDPVTGRVLTPLAFESTSQGFSLDAGKALPSLGLRRVFVLTGPGTCSASESIINALQGVDVQVVQIGSVTCGKPYGFYPRDNCGTTYFAIQFQGVNAKGFGSYADGFTPGGSGGASPPGCLVADDFSHALGDPAEARLKAALDYRITGLCPQAPAATTLDRRLLTRRAPADGVVPKSPLLTNRIVRM